MDWRSFFENGKTVDQWKICNVEMELKLAWGELSSRVLELYVGPNGFLQKMISDIEVYFTDKLICPNQECLTLELYFVAMAKYWLAKVDRWILVKTRPWRPHSNCTQCWSPSWKIWLFSQTMASTQTSLEGCWLKWMEIEMFYHLTQFIKILKSQVFKLDTCRYLTWVSNFNSKNNV